MTQSLYLNELQQELQKRNISDISAILSDYSEHFEHARAKGKSDREIIQALGAASVIAQAYQAQNLVQKIETTPATGKASLYWNAFVKILVLTPFNFFMLMLPGVIIFTLIVTGWAMVLATAGIGLATLGAFPYLSNFVGVWPWVAVIASFLGLVTFSIFLGLIMVYLTSVTSQLILKYLRWNVRMALEK